MWRLFVQQIAFFPRPITKLLQTVFQPVQPPLQTVHLAGLFGQDLAELFGNALLMRQLDLQLDQPFCVIGHLRTPWVKIV